MTDATQSVTPDEFEAFKRRQDERLAPMAIRLEVVSNDTSRLLSDVADLSEAVVELRDDVTALREETRQRFDAVDARFSAVDARFNAVDAHFERLESELTSTREEILKVVNDGHSALLSAIMQLGKR